MAQNFAIPRHFEKDAAVGKRHPFLSNSTILIQEQNPLPGFMYVITTFICSYSLLSVKTDCGGCHAVRLSLLKAKLLNSPFIYKSFFALLTF